MTGIQGINTANNKPFLRAGNTGYTALIGLGLTTASAMTKNKSVKQFHKPLAFLTAGLTLLHLGVILHNRREWERKQKEFIG